MGPICTVGAVTIFSLVLVAQQPRTATAQATKPAPDLAGVWSNPKTGDRITVTVPPNEPMVLTKWAEDQYNYNHDFSPTVGGQRGRNEMDPNSHCFPPGPARLVLQTGPGFGPVEIIQSPKRVLFLYEKDHSVRQVWTDGREHPQDLDLTWMGHSIGKWDGDTLVVDTLGIRDETWLDGAGHVHSNALHIVERYWRPNPDTLRIDMTLEDPKALAQPWARHIALKLRPDLELFEDINCDGRYQRGVFYGEGPAGL